MDGITDTRTVRRQLNDREEAQTTEWVWVTTLSPHRAPTRAVVQLGHARWGIENKGFNELVNHWHADHVYRHASNAMLVFWLIAIVSLNLFLAFYHRNLKPAARKAASMLHIARLDRSRALPRLPGWPGPGSHITRPAFPRRFSRYPRATYPAPRLIPCSDSPKNPCESARRIPTPQPLARTARWTRSCGIAARQLKLLP